MGFHQDRSRATQAALPERLTGFLAEHLSILHVPGLLGGHESYSSNWHCRHIRPAALQAAQPRTGAKPPPLRLGALVELADRAGFCWSATWPLRTLSAQPPE